MAEKSTDNELKNPDETQQKYPFDLETLLNILPDLVCIASADGYFKYLSPGWEKILGYSLEELLYRPLFDFIHPDDYEPTRKEIERQIQGNMTLNYESRYRCKDGSYKTLEWRATPALGDKLFAVARDITERKRADEALRESEESFRRSEVFLNKLLDAIPIPVFYKDRDGKYLGFNNAFENFFGNTKEQLSGKSVFDINSPELAEIYHLKDEELMKSGGVQQYDSLVKNAQGKLHDVMFNKAVLTDNNGTVNGLVGTILDITERKKIEEKLRKSEKLHEEAQRVAKIGHWELASPSDTPTWSEEIFHIFGLDPKKSEPSFAAHVSIIHDEDWDLLDNSIQELSSNGTPFDIEIRILRPEGEIHWMHARGSAEKNEDGNVIRMFGTAQDVTDRKHAERELQEKEQLLSVHLENTPVCAIFWNLDFKVVDWNPAAETIFGYTREEAVGKHAGNLIIPEEIRASIDGVFQDLMTQKGGARSTNENITKDGRRIICDWYNTTLKDSDDKIVGVASLVHDVTERIYTAQELQKEKEIAQGYLDLAPVIFVAINNEGEVTLINQKGCDVLGYDYEEIVGKNWFDNFIPEIDAKIMQVSGQLLNGDIGPVKYYENPVLTKTGEERMVAWHNTVIKDSEDNITGHLSSGEDITDKRRLRAQLQQAQKMESIGNLAGGIAHDFNNILASIIGFTELALDEASNGTTLEDSLQEVYSAGKRAKDLVKQILAFARQSDEKRSPIRPGTIAKEVLKFIRSTIPTTIEIRQDIESNSLIMGNATQVHQVVMNLCTNAAHAMEDSGGVLKVSLKDVVLDKKDLSSGMRQGEYIEIVVSDSGVGIAPGIIESIFDPYFTTKDPGEGTGMGLAMVHGIVENYSGKISVHSQLGKGTAFSIYLPIIGKRSVLHEYVPEQLPSGTERILFVDDEAPIAKMGGQILESLGYSVTTRTSSVEALELFRAKPNDFDLVVTDMTMPNLTGDKLSVELMKIRPDIPVILCTGYSKKISDKTASEIGIKAFAYKPVVKTDLAKTVREVLDEAKGVAQVAHKYPIHEFRSF